MTRDAVTDMLQKRIGCGNEYEKPDIRKYGDGDCKLCGGLFTVRYVKEKRRKMCLKCHNIKIVSEKS